MTAEETTYYFPAAHAALNVAADHNGTFRLRVLGGPGNNAPPTGPLFETTPLRPVARITCGGETFALAVSGHQAAAGTSAHPSSLSLCGQRRVGTETARFTINVAGQNEEEELAWEASVEAPTNLDAFWVFVPFAPGPATPLTLGKNAAPGLAVWRPDKNVVASFVLTRPSSGGDDDPAAARLGCNADGVFLSVEEEQGGGARRLVVGWTMRLAAASTEADARNVHLDHLARVADRVQIAGALPWTPLFPLADRAAGALMVENAADKRGIDRLILRTPGEANRHGCGQDTNPAQAACALHARFRFENNDALRRRALLLARGVCEFQIVDEESTHRGAFWDTLRARKHFEDAEGGQTVSVATTAGAVRDLHHLHGVFGQEILARTAYAGAHWLLLKLNADGFASERFHASGSPVEADSGWAGAHALGALVETFRRMEAMPGRNAASSEVFLKAALRIARALAAGLHEGRLPVEEASTVQIADAVEGVLAVSGEAQSPDLLALAARLGQVLRARRAPNGLVGERDGAVSLPATLAACRAALALCRVDISDALWPLLVVRALRAASARIEAGVWNPRPADHALLAALPHDLLLTLGARAPGGEADRDALTLSRHWQSFAPDPSTRDFVIVKAANGGAPTVDHLALVCPSNLQVLVVALAGPDVCEIEIVKSQKRPLVKNLLTGDYAQTARLIPLGAGGEANVGVFLADT